MLRPGKLTMPNGDTRNVWSPAEYAVIMFDRGAYGVVDFYLTAEEALIDLESRFELRRGLWANAVYSVQPVWQPQRGPYELQADAMLALERAGDKWGRTHLICHTARNGIDHNISREVTKSINAYRQGLKYDLEYLDTLARHEISRAKGV
jgi:hypothetical protein